MFNGSCLCGGVTFSFEEVLGDYVYCHCPSCRKASGSAGPPLEQWRLAAHINLNSAAGDRRDGATAWNSNDLAMRNSFMLCA